MLMFFSGCVETFNEIPNTLSLGGTASLGAMTEAQCKQECIGNPACLAIDFDSAAFGINCFIHTNPANLARRYNVTNVDQYHIVRCPGWSLWRKCGHSDDIFIIAPNVVKWWLLRCNHLRKFCQKFRFRSDVWVRLIITLWVCTKDTYI